MKVGPLLLVRAVAEAAFFLTLMSVLVTIRAVASVFPIPFLEWLGGRVR